MNFAYFKSMCQVPCFKQWLHGNACERDKLTLQLAQVYLTDIWSNREELTRDVPFELGLYELAYKDIQSYIKVCQRYSDVSELLYAEGVSYRVKKFILDFDKRLQEMWQMYQWLSLGIPAVIDKVKCEKLLYLLLRLSAPALYDLKLVCTQFNSVGAEQGTNLFISALKDNNANKGYINEWHSAASSNAEQPKDRLNMNIATASKLLAYLP